MPPLARFRDWRLGKKRRPAGAGGRNRIWRRTPHVRAAEHAGSRPRSLLPGHPADRDVAAPARGGELPHAGAADDPFPAAGEPGRPALRRPHAERDRGDLHPGRAGEQRADHDVRGAADHRVVQRRADCARVRHDSRHPPAGRLAGRRIRDRVGGAETRPAPRGCRRPARDGAHPLRPGDDEPRRRATRDDAVVPAHARDQPRAPRASFVAGIAAAALLQSNTGASMLVITLAGSGLFRFATQRCSSTAPTLVRSCCARSWRSGCTADRCASCAWRISSV